MVPSEIAQASRAVEARSRGFRPTSEEPWAAGTAAAVAYLAERWLRAAELPAGGAGWDVAVHPGLVTELAQLSRP